MIYFFLVYFCTPRCHLTHGCHLTHTSAIMELGDFIQGFARHPRCHLSDGCDAELVNTTHSLTRQPCCRQKQPGPISPMGRYNDGTVKDVLAHTIWQVNTHLLDQNAVHRPFGTSVRRNTVQQYHHTPRKRGEITRRRQTATTHTSSACLLYTSPSPRDGLLSRMPSSA